MTDQELLGQFAATRTPAAFEEIVRRHAGMVHAVARRVLNDAQDAEDVAQAVFLLLARNAKRLSSHRALAGWLHRTAELAARDARKIRERRQRHEREAGTMRTRGTTEAEWSEVRARLDSALSSLPARQRHALVLRYLEGRTEAEAALESGCSIDTLHARVRHGLAKLRAALRRTGMCPSLAALNEMLIDHAREAAPEGLVASIHEACVGSAGASASVLGIVEATMKTIFWLKVKAAALVWAVGLVLLSAGVAVPSILNAAVGTQETVSGEATDAEAPVGGGDLIGLTRRVRTLFIAGAATREYNRLVPCLIRDNAIEVSCWLQSADVDYIQQGNANIKKLPDTFQDWKHFDVVILYDVDPRNITPQQVDHIEGLVKQGGGLMVIGGRNEGLAKLLEVHGARLAPLLPVEVGADQRPNREKVWKEPFVVERTPMGRNSPILWLSQSGERNESIWKTFPKFYWHHPVRAAAPGTIALLERSGPKGDRGTVLMALRRYGKGSVIYSGLDEMWRWRVPRGSFAYDRLWTKTIRYLGASRPKVALRTDRQVYRPGDRAKFSLQILDPSLWKQLKDQVVYKDQTVYAKVISRKHRYETHLSLLPDAEEMTFRGQFTVRHTGVLTAMVKQMPPNATKAAKPLFVANTQFQVSEGDREPKGTRADLDTARAVVEDAEDGTGAPVMPRRGGTKYPDPDPAFLLRPRSFQPDDVRPDLLTPEVTKMADRALAYLASKQDPDGGWSDAKFPANAGVTALCCMAFMGDGSRPRIGRYGEVVHRGVKFILSNVQRSSIIKGGNPYGPMYEHLYGLHALLLAYGDMPGENRRISDVIAKGIQEVLKAQRQDGGWRYQFSREGHSDLSVTANVLWMLRTARKSGFTVSTKAVEKGMKFVENCANPDGTFRYRVFGLNAAPNLGGIAIIALCNDGRINHRLIPNARARIVDDYKRYTTIDLTKRQYAIYGTFYASLAMYTCGEKSWPPWFKKCLKVYVAMQRKDGEFWDDHDRTIYPTAMAAIVLQAPRGYLPIYER